MKKEDRGKNVSPAVVPGIARSPPNKRSPSRPPNWKEHASSTKLEESTKEPEVPAENLTRSSTIVATNEAVKTLATPHLFRSLNLGHVAIGTRVTKAFGRTQAVKAAGCAEDKGRRSEMEDGCIFVDEYAGNDALVLTLPCMIGTQAQNVSITFLFASTRCWALVHG